MNQNFCPLQAENEIEMNFSEKNYDIYLNCFLQIWGLDCDAAEKPLGGALELVRCLIVQAEKGQTFYRYVQTICIHRILYLVELSPSFLLTVSCHKLVEQGLDGCSQPQHRFWTGDQVKGHRECPSLLKVGEPEFGSSKFPLNVCVILMKTWKQKQWRKKCFLHLWIIHSCTSRIPFETTQMKTKQLQLPLLWLQFFLDRDKLLHSDSGWVAARNSRTFKA